jgi:ATP-dependent HslUV protease ATP-binding subunit HslU
VIEDISFDAPDRKGEQIIIDAAFVAERIGEVAADEDLSTYIL